MFSLGKSKRCKYCPGTAERKTKTDTRFNKRKNKTENIRVTYYICGSCAKTQ